jgi:hypothetical protein
LQAPYPFIEAFTLLGDFLRQFPDRSRSNTTELAGLNSALFDQFSDTVEREHLFNPWFTPDSVRRAMLGISKMLEKETLHQWLGQYSFSPASPERRKTVGLVLAGNIPLVGFHDILCVLATGHRIQAKPSSKDDRLIKAVAGVLSQIDDSFENRLEITDGKLAGMDAVIATGSNNSARYFEYYFRGIPHIIRRNRNGVAVLTGNESGSDLAALGEDIFTYFGLGCRNVTKLYIPDNYDLKVLLGELDSFHHLMQHHKYMNNVEYHRSVYLMNKIDFLDNGVLLLKQDHEIASPVGVVFYERYSEIGSVLQTLDQRREEIQCTVSLHPGIINRIRPGKTQEPMPWDYADGVDTIRFLTELT